MSSAAVEESRRKQPQLHSADIHGKTSFSWAIQIALLSIEL